MTPAERLRRALRSAQDRGCAILVLLLVTLPVWVITLAWRGPLFALAALAVLVAAVWLMGVLDRLGGRK